MINLTSIIRSRTYVKNDDVAPQFYRLCKDSDRQSLEKLLVDNPKIEVFDEIEGQLDELFKLRNPSKKFTEEEAQAGIIEHIGSISIEDYGVWVYYPWNNSLVHILDEEEFIESRTNRNMYKITPKEREILAGKKVCVIGLSVGSSVAFILALERVCSELRLVDFDSLELTNLNRIDASIQDLGVAKTTKVARKIAQMDPFIRIRTWNAGANASNLEEIISDGGKIDLLIDECDSLDIKVKLRNKAKEYGIPVLMSTSDAGVLDIERFDKEPGRSIFHGYLDHLDLNLIEGLTTNESKIPYILPILQPATMSARLKASMVEVGQSISTWPQLASDVYAGSGALVGVARDILIGKSINSGRFYIDWNGVIYKNRPSTIKKQVESKREYLDSNTARELIKKCGIPELPGAFKPDESTLEAIVKSGTLAPSGGNCQPWFWYSKGTNLFLLHDIKRSESLLDFEDRGSFLAFGAAAENIQLQAETFGMSTRIRWLRSKANQEVVAVFSFALRKSDFVVDSLAKGIEVRQTNRNIGHREKLNSALIVSLQSESIKIVSDENTIQKIGELSAACERIRIMHDVGHFDFLREMRWTAADALETGDGIDLETVDLSASELAGLEVARDPNTITELNALGEDFGVKLEDLTIKTFRSASSLALITSLDDTLESYADCGRIMQRFWLECNLKDVAIHPVSAPLFLYYRSVKDKDSFSAYQKGVLRDYFELIVSVFGLSDHKPIFLLKMCVAETAKKSARRPLKSLFVKDEKLVTKRHSLGS